MITKKEFAKRCGVSLPTFYSWVKKNKNGLASFVTGAGVDEAVFQEEAWKQYATDRPEATNQGSDLTQLIKVQEETIHYLQEQIKIKDQQIQQLHIVMQTQLQALPAPKEGFFDRLFKRKKKE